MFVPEAPPAVSDDETRKGETEPIFAALCGNGSRRHGECCREAGCSGPDPGDSQCASFPWGYRDSSVGKRLVTKHDGLNLIPRTSNSKSQACCCALVIPRQKQMNSWGCLISLAQLASSRLVRFCQKKKGRSWRDGSVIWLRALFALAEDLDSIPSLHRVAYETL